MTSLHFQTPGFGDHAVEYVAAWELQRQVHAEVVDGGPDTVLLLEHPPVFTAGKRTEPHERPFHGPGQLVGYPIVRLPDHVKVVDYVRRVEEALIHACRDFGLDTARVPGRTGVWLQAGSGRPERKIAAIGIRVSRGVTMHGFALNCDVDLAWYDKFVPCGITDAGVTSLSAELGRDVQVAEAVPVVSGHLEELLAWTPYAPTPDYEPRPDPGRAVPELRVPVLNPLT